MTAGSNPSFEKFTDSAVAELRAEIGKEIVGRPGFIREATEDTIRHFAEGIGDMNPLWLSPEYCETTRFKSLQAPPSIMLAFNRVAWGARGLKGIHSMFAGGRFEWNRRIRLGDRLESKVILKDLVAKDSKFASTAIKQIRQATFTDQAGDVVAVAEPYSFRIERDTAKDRGKYSYLKPAHYSREEYDRIVDETLRESARGSTPRYWEDVTVGERLPDIVRGPLTVTDIIVYLMGQGGQWLRAHGDAARWYRRNPQGGVVNEMGALEPPEIVHWDHEFAHRVGVPAAYDYGPQRIGWLGTLLTNWCGDDGFLRTLDIEIRRFNLIGDTVWCRGSVTAKEVELDHHLVVCEVTGIDQRGESVATGKAVVELPSRAAPDVMTGRW